MAVAADYRNAMLMLLPRGKAWPHHPDSDFGRLFLALAHELVRVENRVHQLMAERNPATTAEMLTDWLNDWGVPGAHVQDTLDASRLRDLLVAKITASGWQSRQYFMDLASSMGFTITIEEYTEADPGPTGYTGDEWNFVWKITAPATDITPARYGVARYGEFYQEWGDDVLESFLRAHAHTHRVLLFASED